MHERSPYRNWVRLSVQAPFHLEATVRVLQRSPTNPVDVWIPGRYRRVLTTSVGLVLAEATDCGTVDQPDVRFIVHPPASAAARVEVARALRRMLGLDVNPLATLALALRERKLRATAQALRGMRPPRFAGLFETFGNVIPFQQLSIEAGVAIVGRLVQRFGKHLEHNGQRIRAFPSPTEISRAPLAALRACGLSNSKAIALREIARMIASDALNEDEIARMSTKDALRVLIGLPGIGSWSAALILLRGFGRLDVFPPGDVGAMRGLRSLLQLGSDAPLGPIETRFGDLRGYLYFYALGARLLAKGLIHPAPDAPSESHAPSILSERRSAATECT
ncbi:MAG TPA: AlkA N-terminal domain-containing protein [Steroidobacter sp.]|nr:AlkA N-terminal domain-containing protein [Steroidobacter sp.]